MTSPDTLKVDNEENDDLSHMKTLHSNVDIATGLSG